MNPIKEVMFRLLLMAGLREQRRRLFDDSLVNKREAQFWFWICDLVKDELGRHYWRLRMSTFK